MTDRNLNSPSDGASNSGETSRRGFLAQSAAAIGSVSVAGAFGSFLAHAKDRSSRKSIGYGRLVPVADETTGLKLKMFIVGIS